MYDTLTSEAASYVQCTITHYLSNDKMHQVPYTRSWKCVNGRLAMNYIS